MTFKTLKISKLIAIISVVLLCNAVTAQTIDDAAVVQYFKITENLKRGNKLDPNAWNVFLQLRGNKLYIDNQNLGSQYWENYRKTMEIVYMPQNDSLLKVQLKKPEKFWTTYMINQYKAHEDKLLQHHKDLVGDKAAYLDLAYKNCYLMLPEKMQKRDANCTIYLTAINNDAVAEENDIIFTLWCAYNFDKVRRGAVVGHELHHILRKPSQYQIQQSDTTIMQVLELILTEGAPDLIDKKLTMDPNFPDELKYGEFLLENGKETLAQLDTLLMEMSLNKRTINQSDIGSVAPLSGHVPGFYMADVIERNGLRKDIVKNIQNPFRFFSTYQKAAKKDKLKPYILSNESMKYLKSIEKRNKILHH